MGWKCSRCRVSSCRDTVLLHLEWSTFALFPPQKRVRGIVLLFLPGLEALPPQRSPIQCLQLVWSWQDSVWSSHWFIQQVSSALLHGSYFSAVILHEKAICGLTRSVRIDKFFPFHEKNCMCLKQWKNLVIGRCVEAEPCITTSMSPGEGTHGFCEIYIKIEL